MLENFPGKNPNRSYFGAESSNADYRRSAADHFPVE